MTRPAWISVAACAAPPAPSSSASARPPGAASRISTSSTSNTSVAPGGMTPPAPRVAVAHVRRDHEPALAADLHADHALVPARDHQAGAERKLEGLVRSTELSNLFALVLGRGSVVQPAGVVHERGLAGFDFGAGAGREVGLLQMPWFQFLWAECCGSRGRLGAAASAAGAGAASLAGFSLRLQATMSQRGQGAS